MIERNLGTFESKTNLVSCYRNGGIGYSTKLKKPKFAYILPHQIYASNFDITNYTMPSFNYDKDLPNFWGEWGSQTPCKRPKNTLDLPHQIYAWFLLCELSIVCRSQKQQNLPNLLGETPGQTTPKLGHPFGLKVPKCYLIRYMHDFYCGSSP